MKLGILNKTDIKILMDLYKLNKGQENYKGRQENFNGKTEEEMVILETLIQQEADGGYIMNFVNDGDIGKVFEGFRDRIIEATEYKEGK